MKKETINEILRKNTISSDDVDLSILLFRLITDAHALKIYLKSKDCFNINESKKKKIIEILELIE